MPIRDLVFAVALGALAVLASLGASSEDCQAGAPDHCTIHLDQERTP